MFALTLNLLRILPNVALGSVAILDNLMVGLGAWLTDPADVVSAGDCVLNISRRVPVAQEAAPPGRVAFAAIITARICIGHSVRTEVLRAVFEQISLRMLSVRQVLGAEVHQLVRLLQIALVCAGELVTRHVLRMPHLVRAIGRLALAAVLSWVGLL